MNFVVFPPGCGYSVADFWGWDAHEARLRCPDEVSGVMCEDEVPGWALKSKSTNYPDHCHHGDLPLPGKIPMVEPGIEPGTSWLVVGNLVHYTTRLVLTKYTKNSWCIVLVFLYTTHLTYLFTGSCRDSLRSECCMPQHKHGTIHSLRSSFLQVSCATTQNVWRYAASGHISCTACADIVVLKGSMECLDCSHNRTFL